MIILKMINYKYGILFETNFDCYGEFQVSTINFAKTIR